jgi:nucleotide-binding universal stress UspA family protein
LEENVKGKIVCAVDFSPGCDAAVEQAARLARALNVELELLHVFLVPSVSFPEGAVMAMPTYVADLSNRAQTCLEEDRAKLADQGIRVTTRLLEGEPARTIVAHAEREHASMIVLGTQGRSGISRFLLGSVADRVVRSSSVPVLTVRDPGAPATVPPPRMD